MKQDFPSFYFPYTSKKIIFGKARNKKELAPDWLETNSHATAIWMLFRRGFRSFWLPSPILLGAAITAGISRENERQTPKQQGRAEYREKKRERVCVCVCV